MEQRSHSRPQPTPQQPTRPLDAARQLLDPAPEVRLAAIRVLGANRYGPAQGSLCAIARAREGEEQVAALDALTQLPLKDDPELFTLAAELTHHNSRTVAEAAHRLLVYVLGEVTGSPSPGPVAAPVVVETIKVPAPRAQAPRVGGLVRDALCAETDGGRTAALRALDRLAIGEQQAAIARLLLEGDLDLVALTARDAITRFSGAELDVRRALCKASLAAFTRFDSSVTRAACADAALALLPSLAAVRLSASVTEAHEVHPLAKALVKLQPRQRREALSNWVRQLNRHDELLPPSMAPLLEHEADLSAAARTQLCAVIVAATERGTEHRAMARHQGTVATLLTKLTMPGSPLPRTLLRALSLSPVIDEQRAAVALCARVGTEEAAGWLETLATKSTPARDAVLQVLKRLPADEFETEVTSTKVRVRGRHKTPKGEPLRSEGRQLLDRKDRRWLLTADGDVVRATKDRLGCRCCHREYMLAEQGSQRPLRCPITNEVHLIAAGNSVVLLSAHDLGACQACDRRHALVWQGSEVRCAGCDKRHVRRGRRWLPETKNIIESMEQEVEWVRSERSELFPRVPDQLLDEGAPPSLFARLQPREARALRATVTLHDATRGKKGRGSGTGFIVARDGGRLAVLTTRHMFETDDDGKRLGTPRAVNATTVVGESVPVRLVWRASGALDVALCVLEIAQTNGIETVGLADDPGHLGDELFTFGNAGGFPWSMFKTRIAGVRDLPTRRGVDARWVQPSDPVPRGMGGCALINDDGEAVGLFSFLQVDSTAAAEIDLFLASSTIRKALVRERVVFAGRPLVKLLGKASD